MVTRILTFTATKYFQQLRFTTRLMILLGSTTFGASFYTSNNKGIGGILFSFLNTGCECSSTCVGRS